MKRIIICTDGTWNTPDQKHRGKRMASNVVKVARSTLPTDLHGVPQITFYDSGVGTGTLADKFIGGITGKGLSDNILEAYRFLVHNFDPGDQLFLFGFSRGAYTARSLAGLIGKMGVIPKKNVFFLNELYQLYKDNHNAVAVKEFKDKYQCESAQIKMVGVWDTVGALGIPTRFLGMLTRNKHTFHDVNLGSQIEHAYHAVAIDERRKPFKPTLWTGDIGQKQIMEQRWFAGVHTNVGGGYSKGGLSNIALHWMIEKAGACGLEVDYEYLSHYEKYPEGKLYNSKKWYYIGSHVRSIKIGSERKETLDSSVCDRMESVATYQPVNVKKVWCL